MQAMTGDTSAPVKVCRTPGGVWHKVESTLGANDGSGFQGRIVYTGQFSGTFGRIQRSSARVNAGGFNLNIGNIETGMVNQRDVGGRADVQLAAHGPIIDATFNLRGPGFSQQITLRGSAGGGCLLADATGTSRFDGQCGSQGLRGVLKTENRMGWRMAVSINTTMQSHQSSAEIALASAAERQRQREAGQEQARDLAKTIADYTTLADAGDPEAMEDLSEIYSDNGSGISDADKSFYWLLAAAQKNYPISMLNVAVAYSNGEGVEKNDTLASLWFLRCAKTPSKYQPDCARAIGVKYENGEGVEKNNASALYWFRYCARLGDSKCDEYANELNGQN